MKFKLYTSADYYNNISDQAVLRELGFDFKCDESGDYIITNRPEIEISSIEELIELSHKFNFGIIIKGQTLELYTHWRED